MNDNELDTTREDWQAEMERLQAGDPGKTLMELVKELGIKRSTMRARLAKLIETGRCKKGIGRRIGAGGVYTVSVYQLIPEKKAGNK